MAIALRIILFVSVAWSLFMLILMAFVAFRASLRKVSEVMDDELGKNVFRTGKAFRKKTNKQTDKRRPK